MLNKDFCVSMDLEEVADKVMGMNYGIHRLLSALVRKRLEM